MTLKQISVFLENRSGSIAELTGILFDAGINISAFSIADTTDFGIVRLILDKPELANEKLAEHGIPAITTDVLAVKLDDVPGSLHKAVSVLSDSNTSIEYSYAFFSPKSGPFAIIRVQDNDAAIEQLNAAGIATITNADFFN